MLARRRVEIACTVELEQTPSSLHAYAVPEGIDIRPGDVVTIHDPPTTVPFGARLTRECRATVLRAGPLARAWTRLCGLFELTELYDVGFSPTPLGPAFLRKEAP